MPGSLAYSFCIIILLCYKNSPTTISFATFNVFFGNQLVKQFLYCGYAYTGLFFHIG